MQKVKCNKTGCKGEVDLDNVKFISPIKMSGKCKKCGKNNFLTRTINTEFNQEQQKKRKQLEKEKKNAKSS